jgi:hypothetical protein
MKARPKRGLRRWVRRRWILEAKWVVVVTSGEEVGLEVE